jgi:hypothetical protein
MVNCTDISIDQALISCISGIFYAYEFRFLKFQGITEPTILAIILLPHLKNTMISTISYPWTKEKSAQLGISEEILTCALDILFQNRNLVNAIDNKIEMDDYIYRAVLKKAFTKYKEQAQLALEEGGSTESLKAEKELSVISREELVTDPFYRAVLPLLIKVVSPEPILRMHAELTSAIVLDLADFKRKHRTTSVTEILVRHCAAELQSSSIN